MPGPGSEEGKSFRVEEKTPSVYNPTNAKPAVWQPSPEDILKMFEKMQKDPVLPLKWVNPGRRPPEKETQDEPMDVASEGEEEEEDKEEERAPEPSAFDFDDTASEASTKVKMTPRTPASAKRPEKKVASMDNILSSLKRQQKAEREARKMQARGSGTPSRMAGVSPTASPRLSAATSPAPVSPRVSAAHTSSPASRQAESGEAAEKKAQASDSPLAKADPTLPLPVAAPTQGDSVQPACSSSGPSSQNPRTEQESAGPSASASPVTGEATVDVKVEKDDEDGSTQESLSMETEGDKGKCVTVKVEGD